MSLQEKVYFYVKSCIRDSFDLENIFKLQEELKTFFKNRLEIIDNTDTSKLIINHIAKILNDYYELTVTGKEFDIKLKDNTFISNSYNRLYITPFNIFVEFNEKLNENMIKLDRNIYKYAKQNAYYIDLKLLKINEINEVYKIKHIDKNKITKLEENLSAKICFNTIHDSWTGRIDSYEYQICLNIYVIETIPECDFHNIEDYYIAYCKSNKVSTFNHLPYKYKLLYNKEDIKDFIYNNNVENYKDFI